MASPRPYKVTTSGAAGAAPSGAVPIELYGAARGPVAANEVSVASIPNLTGANVQLALADIAARLAAVEAK